MHVSMFDINRLTFALEYCGHIRHVVLMFADEKKNKNRKAINKKTKTTHSSNKKNMNNYT